MNLVPWTGKRDERGLFFPSINISEDRKSYLVKAEMPGIDKKDLKVSIHNNILTIKGERKQSREEKGKNTYYKETTYGSFYRQMPLGNEVNEKGIKPEFKNGILTLVLPKKKASKGKAVNISLK